MRRELEKAPEYRFRTPSEPEPMGLGMDKEARGEELTRLPVSDEAREELPPEPENYKPEDLSIHSDYLEYDYKDTSSPAQEYSPPRKPPMKVSQRVREYEPHQTNSTDTSDEDEHLSSLEASVVSLTPRAPHQRDTIPISPEPSMPKGSVGRFSLGFGDDELLAEQVCLLRITQKVQGIYSEANQSNHRLYQQLQELPILQKSRHRLGVTNTTILTNYLGWARRPLHSTNHLM